MPTAAFKEIKVKSFIGARPDGMAADWMTQKDWDDFDAYVEKCKANGTYGNEVEITLLLKPLPEFDSPGIILDLDRIEKHVFKPLMTHWICQQQH